MHQQLSKLKYAAILLTAVLAPTSAVQAATLTTKTYDSSVAVQRTDYDDFLDLQQFDSTLGDLQSIELALLGEVNGKIELESRDASPATVTGNLKAEITLKNPDNSTLLVALPTASETKTFTKYDGVLDFGGTSGATLAGLKSVDSKSKTLTDTSTFAPFIGTGKVKLPVSAIGKSEATGKGNLVAGFETLAGANVRVVYTYLKKVEEPPKKKVPESQVPAGVLAAMGLGMVVTRKFRQQA
ncbi:MAG: choice-of-anchor E domain-containing protein [Scytonematopsis contorta HA4267-MV1]|jgi:hypothetical protein|nr:choice-of-anchor E domain-containing protein [Scytonematopsis contorta HA4267-MV1]